MFKNAGLVLAAIVFAIYSFVFVAYLWKLDHKTIRYNCDLAEISPDFPVEVKEQCRKQKSGRI